MHGPQKSKRCPPRESKERWDRRNGWGRWVGNGKLSKCTDRLEGEGDAFKASARGKLRNTLRRRGRKHLKRELRNQSRTGGVERVPVGANHPRKKPKSLVHREKASPFLKKKGQDHSQRGEASGS